jgi:cell filamentation protein
MDELYEARNSIYCYPDSNVLINKLNIKDNKKLEKAEKMIVLAKLYDLRQNKLVGNFDKDHFINIHKYLFEDLYPFAGKFRTENIAKDSFSFAEWEFIDSELDRLLLKLKEENFLNDLNKEDMAKKLAYYMSELNVLHPFREGNGRTIREFIRELAYKNGYILDYSKTGSEEMLEAMMKSVIDETDLAKIIYKCLEIKND